MTETEGADEVFVAVVSTGGGREINWGSDQLESLTSRMQDLRKAVQSGARAVTSSLDDLPSHPDWRLSEVKGKFGVTLSADAGVILTRAGADATFEIEFTFSSNPTSSL